MFVNVHHQTIKTPSPKKNTTTTSTRQHQAITHSSSYTSQHHEHTSPRFHRNMPETSPTHQNTWSIIRRHTSHSYTGLPKGAQYTNSNWNFGFCLEFRSKCSSMFITKQSKHHHQSKKNINDTTPSHHPLIIINITEPSPHITETSPKHAREFTNTSLKDPQNTTKKTTKQHQNNTQTSPKKDRDKTKTRPRQDRDTTETRPRHDRDITETTPKQHRDITKKRQRQDRDTTKSMNFSILKLSPSTYGSQLHWFAQRCTIYKFKLEFEILLRNPIKMFINVHQKIKTSSPKQ